MEGSARMFLPAFTSELFFSFSFDFSLEFDALEGGFCCQLSWILKSPFKKKFINYYSPFKRPQNRTNGRSSLANLN